VNIAQRHSRQHSRGLTLVEMVVTLVVLAILAGIIAIAYHFVFGKADRIRDIAHATQVAKTFQNESAEQRIPSTILEPSEAAVLDLSIIDYIRNDNETISVGSCLVTLTSVTGAPNPVTCDGIDGDAGAPTSNDSFVLSYPVTSFPTGEQAWELTPEFSGDAGDDIIFTTVPETPLPPGVTIERGTGVIKGPSLWNYKVTQVSSGGAHSCAVATSGAVLCWGLNSDGQLGNPDVEIQTESLVFVDGFLTGGVQVSAGINHTCAVTTAGGVKCWGSNSDGQLGDGSTTSSGTPVNVTGITTAVAVSAGERHTCALLAGGVVQCWGSNNSGELGNANNTGSLVPVTVTVFANGGATYVGAGNGFSCALTDTERVWCWGSDANGLQGRGFFGGSSNYARPIENNPSNVPRPAERLTNVDVTQLSVGRYHSCLLTVEQKVFCWGYGYTSTPASVEFFTGVPESVEVYDMFDTCATMSDGSVQCGSRYGSTTTPFPAGSNVLSLSGGSNHACAVLPGMVAKCWGQDTNGQLGNGSNYATSNPGLVMYTGPQPGFPFNVTIRVTWVIVTTQYESTFSFTFTQS
jgi:prepilin-type N-terminal cleavage/methylation domain-containing protein